MSKLQLSPNPSGAGIVTLAAPNTASDVTLTLPAVTAELITNSSGVLNIGSGQVYKDASGNVGIGRVPNYKIDAYTSGTGSPAVASSNDNIVTILQSSGSSQGNIGTITSHPLVLLAANAERVRIDTSGNLLVGTTSASAKLTVETSGASDCIRANNATSASASQLLFWGRANGSDRFYVLNTGDVQNANNSYGAFSDIKLKENIVDASPKLDKLNQVRIVNYSLKSNPDHKLLGVVAQELELIFPGMIEEIPDRDSEGKALETTTKSVKYSVFVPMLIKAIQELTARLEVLENK